jgi:hypothetical protein
MYRYDFDRFIAEVRDLGYVEMIAEADREAGQVERNLYGRGKTARMKQEAGGREYRHLLGGFLWLLRTGTKPQSVSEWDFLRMRPAIESLVERGIMKPEAMAVFGERAKAAGDSAFD